MDETPVISISRLCKEYRSDAGVQPVLKDVSVKIDPGEFVAIMGPSGSGKSTFMNILGCLDLQTSGSYLLNGVDVSTLGNDAKADFRNRMLGFVFQGFNLLSRVDLVANVALPLIYAKVDNGERKKRAMEMLVKLGLGGHLSHMPNQISGGQQQRVAIGRALINNPKLILADEPTGNLDSKTAGEIMELLKELNEKDRITIVLVTHEQDIAVYAKRVIRFFDGKIQSDTPTSGSKV